MDLTGDELAGVVDLFGGLTREQLARGLAELAFKQGEEHDPSAFEADIEQAVADYQLVELDPAELAAESAAGDIERESEEPLLVVGPAALPALPEDASDLRHILDAPDLEIDRAIAGERAAERFRQEAATAVDEADASRVTFLVDVSYDIEAWAPVDLASERERLNDLG